MNFSKNSIGITLIDIPYWWNFDKESLSSTIYHYRPDLFSEAPKGEVENSEKFLRKSIGEPIPKELTKIQRNKSNGTKSSAPSEKGSKILRKFIYHTITQS